MSPGRQRVARSLSWVEIESAALVANLHAFHERLGTGVELVHVVKSNAYGHGLELVAREAEASGLVHRLGVISVEELVRIRAARIKLPVLLLGYVPLAAWPEVVDHEGDPVVFNRESLHALSKAASERGRQVRVHLKVETGTHRYGIPRAELVEHARLTRELPGIVLEGLTTHFANIEDTTDHSYAEHQMEEFEAALEDLREAGFEIPRPHAACSAAAILFPRSHHALARVGISAYGIWPSKQTLVSSKHVTGAGFPLRAALSWKTRVGQIKTVPAGSFVGYGCSWRAPSDTRLAVLPVGYADGFDRRLGNTGHVLLRGKRAPLRGRVCMNVIMVDVTHIPDVALEDEVVLIGGQGDETITADMMGEWCGTIAYETVARIAESLPRVRV